MLSPRRVVARGLASNVVRYTSHLTSIPSTLSSSLHGYSMVDSEPPKKRPGPPQHLISTLNQTLIRPGDYLDLSNRRLSKAAFPENCTGFLYYHRDSRAAFLEGSIRFRRTSDAQPSSFPTGEDLLLPSGTPWQIILPQVARYSNGRFCDQLLRENLATTAQLDRCCSLFGTRHISPSLIIFRLQQEFPVNFDNGIRLTLVVGETLLSITTLAFRATVHRVQCFPFTGSAIVRFEPSVDDGRRILRMRIVKIVAPVVCTLPEYKEGRISEPKEGQFLTVAHRGGTPAPWQLDLGGKSKFATAMRALWNYSISCGYSLQSEPTMSYWVTNPKFYLSQTRFASGVRNLRALAVRRLCRLGDVEIDPRMQEEGVKFDGHDVAGWNHRCPWCPCVFPLCHCAKLQQEQGPLNEAVVFRSTAVRFPWIDVAIRVTRSELQRYGKEAGTLQCGRFSPCGVAIS
ncbi:hypothetical protein C8F04DRAFT_1344255 [Mycena alexandri]|uniref:Uncharacterized protein n=1 Tax=Mycena alexandri TaxID=1745969 RepID=A0AAD6SYX4_9AGAR|nr:hypothetical protein C8F04DRAFT_1344255 [Mycena alexandri]